MVLETNRYAAEQIAQLQNAGRLALNFCVSKWRDTDITEMKAWVGIGRSMGYIQLPNYHAYWATNPLRRQHGIQQIMTRDSFITILQFLHLCDNSQVLPADHEDHNRIFKIRTFMEQVLIPIVARSLLSRAGCFCWRNIGGFQRKNCSNAIQTQKAT